MRWLDWIEDLAAVLCLGAMVWGLLVIGYALG